MDYKGVRINCAHRRNKVNLMNFSLKSGSAIVFYVVIALGIIATIAVGVLELIKLGL